MRDSQTRRTRMKRAPQPLDQARLEELALAYVARFATTATRLEAYLSRKLRERGWSEEAGPDLARLVERHVALGHVDDRAYARMKAASLLARGYGERRIAEALHAAGVDEEAREEVAPDDCRARAAALALARRRRFGPFGRQLPDRPQRERQIAAMVRAGHGFATARALVDAASSDEAEVWAAAAEDQA